MGSLNPHDPRFPLWMDSPAVQQALTLDMVPGMCPESGNPLPGSTLTLHFPDGRGAPEVVAVAAEARLAMAQLVGGHGAIRSMEDAAAYVAGRVAALLGCDVACEARLRIAPPGEAELWQTFTVYGERP